MASVPSIPIFPMSVTYHDRIIHIDLLNGFRYVPNSFPGWFDIFNMTITSHWPLQYTQKEFQRLFNKLVGGRVKGERGARINLNYTGTFLVHPVMHHIFPSAVGLKCKLYLALCTFVRSHFFNLVNMTSKVSWLVFSLCVSWEVFSWNRDFDLKNSQGTFPHKKRI